MGETKTYTQQIGNADKRVLIDFRSINDWIVAHGGLTYIVWQEVQCVPSKTGLEVVTADGDLRLWGAETETWSHPKSEGFMLVRADDLDRSPDPYSKEALMERGRAIIAEADASIAESGVRPEDAYKEASKGE